MTDKVLERPSLGLSLEGVQIAGGSRGTSGLILEKGSSVQLGSPGGEQEGEGGRQAMGVAFLRSSLSLDPR